MCVCLGGGGFLLVACFGFVKLEWGMIGVCLCVSMV